MTNKAHSSIEPIHQLLLNFQTNLYHEISILNKKMRFYLHQIVIYLIKIKHWKIYIIFDYLLIISFCIPGLDIFATFLRNRSTLRDRRPTWKNGILDLNEAVYQSSVTLWLIVELVEKKFMTKKITDEIGCR